MKTAVATVLSKYATFSGRATRAEYWWWVLFVGLVAAVLALLAIVPGIGILFVVLLWIFNLGVLIPMLAVSIRRLRDGGFHWAFILLHFVPVIGSIALFVMYLMPSKE